MLFVYLFFCKKQEIYVYLTLNLMLLESLFFYLQNHATFVIMQIRAQDSFNTKGQISYNRECELSLKVGMPGRQNPPKNPLLTLSPLQLSSADLQPWLVSQTALSPDYAEQMAPSQSPIS